MLYYSQGKGDTDEKVKTWRTQRLKSWNAKRKTETDDPSKDNSERNGKNGKPKKSGLDNTAEREVNQRC